MVVSSVYIVVLTSITVLWLAWMVSGPSSFSFCVWGCWWILLSIAGTMRHVQILQDGVLVRFLLGSASRPGSALLMGLCWFCCCL